MQRELARRGSCMTATPARPLTVLIAALGGEGGGVLTGWIVDAAGALGFPVQSTSIPGVAQRTDGSLLMTMRTAMGTQFYSESADQGETWTPPRSLELISPQAPASRTIIVFFNIFRFPFSWPPLAALAISTRWCALGPAVFRSCRALRVVAAI